MKQLLSLVLVGLCVTGFAQKKLHKLAIPTVAKAQEFWHYTPQHRPFLSAHRGGARPGFPENCLETFEHTLEHTYATFEIDPRLTKDSVIVLLHDATLNRTSNGTGKLRDYTWQEVQQFRLKDSEGKLTDFRIPTLEDAIEWARGKTVLILDYKDVPFDKTLEIIRKHQAEAFVMVTVHTAKDAQYYHQRNPDILFEAFVHTEKALHEYEAVGIPWKQVMAYIGSQTKPEHPALIEELHQRGVMAMVAAGPVYDKEYKAGKTDVYQTILKAGADLIETDLPIQVNQGMQPMIPKKSDKNAFFK